jgi:hypothetical protein
MKRVTGIGGIFFKSKNPENMKQWYQQHLGIVSDEHGATFRWREEENADNFGYTVWSPFPQDTEYFAPSTEGVEVDERIETYDYGRFAWITDPEGNRVELWEPSTIDNTLSGSEKDGTPQQ